MYNLMQGIHWHNQNSNTMAALEGLVQIGHGHSSLIGKKGLDGLALFALDLKKAAVVYFLCLIGNFCPIFLILLERLIRPIRLLCITGLMV